LAVFLAAICASNAAHAAPSVATALKFVPKQKNVEYDTPTEAEIEKCTITAARVGEHTGWIVRGPNEQILRRFLDSDGDKQVDQWCYYKDGIEVYRDIDADSDGKTDQHRWLNTAGMRWAIDDDEDGVIDRWREISAEEVSAEVVAAIARRETERFELVLLSAKELDSLELGKEKTDEIAKRIEAAAAAFEQLAARQAKIGPESRWVHFTASKPGVVPAGTDDSARDLVVYENVVAMVETDKKLADVYMGTFVRVGQAWRLIDAPRLDVTTQASTGDAGLFFQAVHTKLPNNAGSENDPGNIGTSKELQEHLDKLQKIESELARATSVEAKSKLHATRTETLVAVIASVADREEREQWIRQLADTLSLAIQAGEYEEGTKKLASLVEQLSKDEANLDLASYATYRQLTADYARQLAEPKADYGKVQGAWLKQLAAFVKQYPKSADAAEAMLQLGLAAEFAGEEDKAKEWYQQVVDSRQAGELPAKKAAGAIRRLDSPGKTIDFTGRTVDAKNFSLEAYRGRVVVVNYWATWCEPCKKDMVALQTLNTKYARHGLTIVSISLDSDLNALSAYLRANPMPWVHLNEPAGLDGPLATQLGVLTLPKLLLIDKSGKVANRDAHSGGLDADLRRLLAK
jgi:thiol-disulfide isomerase/thioredoxin